LSVSAGRLSDERLDLIARYMGQEPADDTHVEPRTVEEAPPPAEPPAPLRLAVEPAAAAPHYAAPRPPQFRAPQLRAPQLPHHGVYVTLVRARLPVVVLVLALLVAYLATHA
jgi:hypothetical protein